MPRETQVEHGRALLSAVERLISPTDTLIALTERHHASARLRAGTEERVRRAAAESLTRHFSDRAALVGAASALPGAIPGVGTAAALVSGTLLDVTFLLKWEVELALCLAWLHGFDIRDNSERQLAFLMASVGTYDAQTGRNFFLEVMEAEREAIWNYSSRRLGKFITEAFATLALMRLGRGFMKLLPLVGPLVGAAANKLLTRRVGERCAQDFETRRKITARKSEVKRERAKSAPSRARRARAS